MISGQCLTERRCGAYVDVEMFGLPADIVRKMYRTKVVQNNTVNPVFDEEPFTFKVCIPLHLSIACCIVIGFFFLFSFKILYSMFIFFSQNQDNPELDKYYLSSYSQAILLLEFI